MAFRIPLPDLSPLPLAFEGAAESHEKTRDLLLGLALLFATVGVLLASAAAFSGFPFVALGAAFAFPAALAFAVRARRVRAVERVAHAPAVVPRPRINAIVAMRKAA